MSPDSSDPRFFIPAATTAEAVARMFSLTGGQPRGRGEKRALVALRDALGLDVDIVRTNAVLGGHLASALGVAWSPRLHTLRNTLTLAGLNHILLAATEAYRKGSLTQVSRSVPPALTGPVWSMFRPAVSKIEAVTRIARITNSPDEWLGPGSKEHKSVFLNLADTLFPGEELDRSSKTRLGGALADKLGVGWADTCVSTGETISLEGLNTILAGTEKRLGRLGTTAAELLASPEAEGTALAAALNDGWGPEPWDGRRMIGWMHRQPVRGANDNEWQGWYFEARGREILNAAIPPSGRRVRARYSGTTFDYSLNYVWDLKAHTEAQVYPVTGNRARGRPTMILNDEHAIRECVADQGLGFLVLGGSAQMDESREFVRWHRAFKKENGVRSAPSNSGRSRIRKASFTPLRVEAFWIADTAALLAAIAAGQLSVHAQGRQAPRSEGGGGAARRDKLHMDVARARASLRVAERLWT